MGRAWMLATTIAMAPLVAVSQQPEASDPAQQAPVFTSRQVQGSLQQWDAESGRLVIEDQGSRTQLELQEGSTVFIEGRLGRPTELAAGQLVRAAYQERDGKQYVRWIEVTAPKPPTDPGRKKRRPRSERPPAAPAFGPYEGVVEEVSPETGSFVLSSIEGPWTIELREGVTLLVGGQQSTLDALTAGMRVRAEWVANASPRTLRLEVIETAAPR